MSSGFLFFDTHRDLRLFFEENDRNEPKTYRTQYLWINEDKARWSELVHWLFVYVRTTQAAYAKQVGMRTEDYFRHIPKDDALGCCFAEEDRILRKTHALHYVTLGEMLFSLLAWRSLSAAVELYGTDHPLSKLTIALDEEIGKTRTCSWDSVDLFRLEPTGEREIRLAELRGAWVALGGPKSRLRSDWELLGVTSASHASQSTELTALLRFAGAVDAVKFAADSRLTSDSELNAAIQRNIGDFIERLGAPERPSTVGEALQAMERYARFPLLPFYMWNALDRAPKCYLVSPVWTSQQYSVSVDNVECRHLGLGLSAVAPLRRIDWTLPADLPSSFGPRYSDSDPTVITNVIRLMARPLVEAHLYADLVRVMRVQEANVRRQSNEAVLTAIRQDQDTDRFDQGGTT